MTIRRREYDLLSGLQDAGHAYISASEAEDARRLEAAGHVRTWDTICGFRAWSLTDEGRKRIEYVKARFVAIID